MYIIFHNCFQCGRSATSTLMIDYYIGMTPGGNLPKRCRDVKACMEYRYKLAEYIRSAENIKPCGVKECFHRCALYLLADAEEEFCDHDYCHGDWRYGDLAG